ncbi:MAG: 4-hydroxy-3-methylbut-2-enyl diphosphate reductase [Eubacterium sp.]|nr:4-hydroxy-3-methylbut-2-enyl diphosphate reductase [Eubacterium sp.]
MKITVAESAGFCFGVKRAVDEVYNQIEHGKKPVYTFGPVIHNEQVMQELEATGVSVVESLEDLEQLDSSSGTLIIRAHGVSRRTEEKMRTSGLNIIDTTCPFVKKIHAIVQEKSREGLSVIIAGNPDHPEVKGIRGWAEGPVYIVETPEEMQALELPDGASAVLVAQTTFNLLKFEYMVEIFSQKRYYNTVVNTVCNATTKRQAEARRIAAEVDAMLVIGGRHSSNTQKLCEICKAGCKNTYFIETLVDLETIPFQSFCHVGITAGASTPNQIIEEVQEKLCQKN